MSSLPGKVPFLSTSSQMPFVEIETDAGATGDRPSCDPTVESCWTNGSLLLNRPNETSLSEPDCRVTRSVSGSVPGATDGGEPGSDSAAIVVGGDALWDEPEPPSIFG